MCVEPLPVHEQGALLGGFSGIGGGPFYGTGYYGGGGLGLVVVILLILLLMGRLQSFQRNRNFRPTLEARSLVARDAALQAACLDSLEGVRILAIQHCNQLGKRFPPVAVAHVIK
jgi:hypothetical protein